jgi:hypothetical protein
MLQCGICISSFFKSGVFYYWKCGAGSSFQIIFRDHDSFAITPFIYFSGTVFYQKKISSTVTLRGRHASTGGFLYISKKHHEINNGFSWLDLAASIDFYF